MTAPVDADPFRHDPLSQRLLRLEIPTPSVLLNLRLGDGAAHRRPGAASRRARRTLAVGGAAAATVTAGVLLIDAVGGGGHPAPVTLHIPGFTVLVAASAPPVAPHTTREQATAAAQAWLKQHPVEAKDHAEYAGFDVSRATFEARVLKVWEDCGAHWFLNAPENLWVIDLRAPAQHGSAYVQASVLVDDASGSVRYADAITGSAGPSGC